jgi:5-methylcytosine-specific restriction endonuclease McrA
MDHVVPIARGGWHAIGNILPACFSCNSSKRDDLLIYWRTKTPSARLKQASL